MAKEKKGFFKRLFGQEKQPEELEAEDGAAEESEVEASEAETPEEASDERRTDYQLHPEGVAGLTRETDVSVSTDEEPEPDLHRPAAATSEADEEAAEFIEHPLAPEAEEEEPQSLRGTEPAGETGTGGASGAEELEADVVQVEEPAPAAAPTRQSWLQRLTAGLSKSSTSITSRITGSFTKRRLDDETLEELEDVLISADLGVETATAITERLAKERYDKSVGEDEIKTILADEVAKALAPVAEPLRIDAAKRPFVILVVGVNGSGKTTTIGKLAAKLRAEGRSVMLAAGDTFRAAAIEQLKIWGERTRSAVIAREQGADAAGLAFDAMQEAKNTGTDVLIIDTAGRLQNRAELMAELEKVVRVIKKHDPEAPHRTLLTLDATTGQNAMQQVEIFGQKAGVTGLVMTKLDGTARGGILVAIAAKHELPVHFIGVGEGVEDLQPFKAEDFARAIAGL